MKQRSTQVTEYKGEFRSDDWVAFPGGELEGRRPKRLCSSCRAALEQGQARNTLCFECYRTDAARERALKAAGGLNTASEERFQSALPFEAVDRARLTMLKAARAESRMQQQQGVGRFVDKRRQAQLAARHALQRIASGLATRHPARAAHARQLSAAIHAAELQLPESWLPFVVSR